MPALYEIVAHHPKLNRQQINKREQVTVDGSPKKGTPRL